MIELLNTTMTAEKLNVSQQYIQMLVNGKKKSKWFVSPKYRIGSVYAWDHEQINEMKRNKK